MAFSGTELGRLHAALLQAFPNRSSLAELLRFGLNVRLNEISGNGDLRSTLLDVLEWTEARDRTSELIREARRLNATSPELEAVAAELFQENAGNPERSAEAMHPLHFYPCGPLVDEPLVRPVLIEGFAAAYPPQRAEALVTEANAQRQAADPDDETVTLIRDLPLSEYVGARLYWSRAFAEARLNGPRMLAALLLAADEDRLPVQARSERNKLLKTLKKAS